MCLVASTTAVSASTPPRIMVVIRAPLIMITRGKLAALLKRMSRPSRPSCELHPVGESDNSALCGYAQESLFARAYEKIKRGLLDGRYGALNKQGAGRPQVARLPEDTHLNFFDLRNRISRTCSSGLLELKRWVEKMCCCCRKAM